LNILAISGNSKQFLFCFQNKNKKVTPMVSLIPCKDKNSRTTPSGRKLIQAEPRMSIDSCKNNTRTRSISMVSKPFFLRFLLLNKLYRTALKLRSSSISFFWGHLPFFIFWGVKIRLQTENQLPRLPQSALKVPGWWWWWVCNH
jgi:hypothetical protein